MISSKRGSKSEKLDVLMWQRNEDILRILQEIKMRKERRKAVEASIEKEIEGERRWRLKREESRKSEEGR